MSRLDHARFGTLGFFAIIVFSLALGLWCAACGGGSGNDGDGGSNSAIETRVEHTTDDPRFLTSYGTLYDCLLAHGYEATPIAPPVEYVPTVRCQNGAFCCVTPTRGDKELDGVVYLPDRCGGDNHSAASNWWLPIAYMHAALHTRLPDHDVCHASPLWRACMPPEEFIEGCTP